MNEQKINRGTHGDSLLILVSLETLSKKPPLQAWNAKWWEHVTDWIDDGDFDGKYKITITGNQGYVAFDGDFDDVSFTDGYAVGGIYWADDMIIVALCESDKKKDVEKIDLFIDALGYPSI